MTLSYFLLEISINTEKTKLNTGGSATFRLLGLRVRMSSRSLMFAVTVVRCAGRGLCGWPIPRPEESYRVFMCH